MLKECAAHSVRNIKSFPISSRLFSGIEKDRENPFWESYKEQYWILFFYRSYSSWPACESLRPNGPMLIHIDSLQDRSAAKT